MAKACHRRGLKTVAVTAGYVCEAARAEFFAHMDAANVDLKAFTEDFYRVHTKSQLKPVLDTLRYLKHETDVWLEITTLLIPGLNDSDDELRALTKWVATELGCDVPIHFSAFHPDYRMREGTRTPPSTLQRARDLALKSGLRYAYTGNVHDSRGGSTYCHNCDAQLIERDWYELGAYGLDDAGNCASCGTSCAGVFEGVPGSWGRRRLPLVMSD